MSVRLLLLDMRVRLLMAPDGADAVRVAAVCAEATLKQLLRVEPTAGAGLGEMIGEVHRDPALKERLGRGLLSELSWLNELRIRSVHFKGGVERPSLDEGKRAVDAVTAVASEVGLVAAGEVERIQREAEWKASTPATSSILKLDRRHQRAALDDLLGTPRRVLAVLIDGEVGQGHDHFGEVIHWRLRAGPRGQWRMIEVEWPPPSESPGVRFAQLLESLGHALDAGLELPQSDPFGDAAEQWDRVGAALLGRIDRIRRRVCIRHRVGWLDAGDPELMRAYLERVWSPATGGERAVLSFEVMRAPAGGFPLSRSWRVGRRERRLAESIGRELANLRMPVECRSAALDELTSVSAADLVEWFRNELGEPRAAAEASAAEILAASEGGRFELVLKRLAPLSGRRQGTSS